MVFALTTFLSCRQAKYVAEGDYLLKKNKIVFVTYDENGQLVKDEEHEGIYTGDMYDLIKPVPYKGTKLFFYNRIDTTRYQNQLDRKHDKCMEENDERKAKEDEINKKRIEKAKSQGKSYYNHKDKKMKDIKNGWRDWVIVHMGMPPVLMDTALVKKSDQQLAIYMKQRGYFDATVQDTILYKKPKKKKAIVEYIVNPGEPYRIDSFSLAPKTDPEIITQYKNFNKADKSVIVEGSLIDEDMLNLERENFSAFCRDQGALFGLNKNYITFKVDTLGKGHSAIVYMHVAPIGVPHPSIPDSIVYLPYRGYKVSNVTFMLHNPPKDTLSFKYGFSAFKKRCDAMGLPYESDGYYSLLDTLINIDTIIYRKKDPLITHKGVYIYNDIPFLEPDLIDKQNFLYIPHWAKEEYLERSYRTMLQLDVFSTITPEIKIDPANPLGRNVVVTYHLVPAKRSTFTLEPRVTNSNSVLGLMGSVSYSNKNLARGAQKLKISFNGGFESQPLIITESGAQSRIRKLNTFEWGPSIQLSFPKLVPMPKKVWATFSKRLYPSTKFDLTVNIQRRIEFDRRLAHFTYEWNFKQGKMQEWGLQFVNFDFVRLEKDSVFAVRLDSLNDPFLINSYADHFTLFNGLVYKINTQVPNVYNKTIFNLVINVIQSGGILNFTGLGSNNLSDDGLKQIFGVPFAQFVRFDNQILYQYRFNRKHKIATRLLTGVGWAYGNSPSLPYEQSFVAGGSNDIRAFEARTMAPGSIRILEDTLATNTQIGDMRLELNLEYRFKMNDMLEGAIFVDMGNIWKIKDDPSTPKDDLGVFHFNSFYRQTAIGTGFGVRADFEFLIVRLDMSFPLHNPYLPAGEKWFGTPHTVYKSSFDYNNNGKIDAGYEQSWYKAPFAMRFNFGIGYPF